MILHLVTDRRRLAQAGDETARARCLLDQVWRAVEAEIDVIQLRERDLEAAALLRLATAMLALVAGSRTRLVINERLDVALAAGAHGVHLRAGSIAADRVRTIAPGGFLVGRSIHSEAEARSAGPVDYLIAGSVWPTSGKPEGHPVLAPEGLARIVRAAAVPVIAIGGVEPSRAQAIRDAGAAGVAAIAAWMAPAVDHPCRAMPLQERARAFRDASVADNMGRFLRP